MRLRSLPSALIVVAIAAFGVGGAVTTIAYGSRDLFPGLVANFGASLGAFMLALAWERDRERRQAESAAAEVDTRRVTEVRRRLAPVRAELEKNAESLIVLAHYFEAQDDEFLIFQPQLLEGGWIANAPRLSELVADYGLISDLATTYGRLEELRRRLRYRTEHLSTALDAMAAALVADLDSEIADLIERVREQIDRPDVVTHGLVHVRTGTLGAQPP